MKSTKKTGWAVVLILGLALLAACSQRVTRAPEEEAIVRQAAVSEVEVLRSLGGKPGVLVLARGTLSDGCWRLGDAVVQRGETLFAVILPLQRVSLRECPPGPLPFERAVALDVEGLEGATYTVMVNGVTESFDLPASAAMVQATQTLLPEKGDEPTRVAQAGITATATPDEGAGEEQDAPDQEEAQVEVLPEVKAEGDPTPSAMPTQEDQNLGVELDDKDCVNKAAFYDDVTVPDGTMFDPGQSFTKTWRVRNAGTCSWQGYALVYRQGERLAPAERQPIERTVAPGDVVDVSLPMKAPDKPGGYQTEWQFSAADGATFGVGAAANGMLWAKIGVRTLLPVTGGPQADCAYQENAGYESEALALINAARVERGLKPLLFNDKLTDASREHSQDMACHDFVEHYGSDGSTPLGRIQARGLRYKSASENIYAGNPDYGGTPDGAFNWWMNSQIHRDAILNPRYAWVGIGYVYYEGSQYKGYYTVKFMEP